MNPTNSEIHFPARPVELKVKRAPASPRAESGTFAGAPRHTVAPFGDTASDLEVLRVCEDNLRAYEERLREWQDQLEQAQLQAIPQRTANPWALRVTATEPARQDAWGKLLRARELLEVEQKHLRDDRITLQGMEQHLQEREARLAAREVRVDSREQQLAQFAAEAAAAPVRKKPVFEMASLTRSPFAIAKSVFGAKA